MTDVFISYSRRDKVFTQKLVDALHAANRDVWADWNSIPAASDWDAEIKEGIEKTDTVLFLLSPEWIKSNECRKEMIHAIQHGKRLIPILYLMPDQGQEVPPELAKINWVYMRDTDNFDKAFETLQSAMDTDLDWIKTHTRVQVRAIEWDKKKRDNSFTLRGKDLTDGEQFISGATGKSPEPTQLQGEYVLASRKDATRRQRITLAGVTIALVVSIALGITAYFQRQVAVANEKTANANFLGAQTNLLITTDFQQSLLLGIESFRFMDKSITRGALLDASAANPAILQYLEGHTNQAFTVAFSPNGQILASGDFDGTILLWDVATGKQIGQPLTGHTDTIYSLAFSPDGKTLASSSNTIMLWDVETGKPIGEALKMDTTDAAIRVAFSPDGKTLASGSTDSTIMLWDVSTGKRIGKPLTGHTDSVISVVFVQNGKTLASGSADNTIRFWDVATGQPIGEPLTGHTGIITTMATNPTGEMLASGSMDGSIIVWDVATGSPIGEPLRGHDDIITSVAISPDGLNVVSGSADQSIKMWGIGLGVSFDIVTPRVIGRVNALTLSPDGKTLAVADNSSSVILLTTEHTNPIGKRISSQTEGLTTMSLSPDGKILANTGLYSDTIVLVDVTTGNPIGQPLTGHTDTIWELAFSPDSKTLASAGGMDGSIRLWDVATGKPIGQPLIGHTDTIYSLAFSPDGKTLASGYNDKTIILWDLKTGKPIGQPLSGHTDAVISIAFSPDGKTLASVGGFPDNTIRLWDVATGKPVGQPLTGRTKTSNAMDLVFSLDGKTLISGSTDQSIILWDVETGKPIGEPLTGATNAVTDLALSPDGNILASGYADQTVRLWDIATGKPIGQPLLGHNGPLVQVSFSPDGKTLVSGSQYGNIILFNLETDYWIERSCERAGRNFTQAEWSEYFPNVTYRKTCEQWPLETEDASVSIPFPTPYPTSATTATPISDLNDSTSLPGSDNGIIYQDDFSQKTDYYEYFNFEQATSDIANGVYSIKVNTPNTWVIPTSGIEANDNDISADIQQSSGNADQSSVYGLTCRITQQGGYVFAVTGDGNALILKKNDSGQFSLISDVIPVSSYNSGGSVNRLSVSCVGDQLTLSVNGEVIIQITDNSYATGYLGFAAFSLDTSPSPLQVNFDNLVISEPGKLPATTAPASQGSSNEQTGNNVLYQDDFSTPNAKLEKYTGKEGIAGVSNGVFSLINKSDYWWISPIPVPASDSVASVQLRQVSGPANNNTGFGLMCRQTKNTAGFSQGYLFAISGDGFASISLLKGDGSVTSLADWTASSLIKQGDANNTLIASCLGDKLTLAVNDEVVLEAVDSTFTNGEFAFVAASFEKDSLEVQVEFDNLVITQP